MTEQDVTGALVLSLATLIAVVELALSGWIFSRPPLCRAEDERPSSLPDRYIAGSDSDPFQIDTSRFRR
jgi:hypothetical protein